MNAYELGFAIGMRKQALNYYKGISPEEIWDFIASDYDLTPEQGKKIFDAVRSGKTITDPLHKAIGDRFRTHMHWDDALVDAADASRRSHGWWRRSVNLSGKMGEQEKQISQHAGTVAKLKNLIKRNKKLALAIGIPAVAAAGIGGYYYGKSRGKKEADDTRSEETPT